MLMNVITNDGIKFAYTRSQQKSSYYVIDYVDIVKVVGYFCFIILYSDNTSPSNAENSETDAECEYS